MHLEDVFIQCEFHSIKTILKHYRKINNNKNLNKNYNGI